MTEIDHTRSRLRAPDIRWLVVFLAMAVLSIAAAVRSDARPFISLIFSTAFLAIPAAALLRPRSYAFTILGLFLLLGFWLKYSALAVARIRLLEPIGSFNGSLEQWDRTLIYSAAGAAGVLAARLAEVAFRRRRVEPLPDPTAPHWYVRNRHAVWITFLSVLALLTIANFRGAFYQTGLNTVAVLPSHLTVVIAWLVQSGMGLLLTVPVWWEIRASRYQVPAIQAALLEALVTSVSTLSRVLFLLRVIPYALVFNEDRGSLRGFTRRGIASVSAAAVAAFGASLFLVMGARAVLYPALIVTGSTPAENPVSRAPATTGIARTVPATDGTFGEPSRPAQRAEGVGMRARFAGGELMSMVTGRWIGIEGVMAIASSAERGPRMFAAMIREDPKLGLLSTFQRTAGAPYEANRSFTFMTIPGFIAVLASSGSAVVVALGSFFLTLLLLSFERATVYLRLNPFSVAFVSCVLANALCQMNFPFLALVFFGEMIAAVLLLAAILRAIAVRDRERSVAI